MGGVLAIDYGDKKCGFASTDALRIAREPLGVLRHEGRVELLLEHLERLLAERDVATLLVGLPLHMDGRPGARAAVVAGFVARLRARFPALDVQEWDERLTSKEAEARLRALGRKGREIRAERDSWSALVLLDDWLRSHETRSR
ncbi:MAG: Holliday junction resolvase RuvX [Planctomycetes bacterium]|nr:Holliday junction resolvase RuvX [Planctomycetota bacterium]